MFIYIEVNTNILKNIYMQSLPKLKDRCTEIT